MSRNEPRLRERRLVNVDVRPGKVSENQENQPKMRATSVSDLKDAEMCMGKVCMGVSSHPGRRRGDEYRTRLQQTRRRRHVPWLLGSAAD